MFIAFYIICKKNYIKGVNKVDTINVADVHLCINAVLNKHRQLDKYCIQMR